MVAARDQNETFDEVLSYLAGIGYVGDLLQRNYGFIDWLDPLRAERVVPAACFGQTPTAYDSACLSVLLPKGDDAQAMVTRVRALGAGMALAVHADRVDRFNVHTRGALFQESYPRKDLAKVFDHWAQQWGPAEMMRARNIAAVGAPSQLQFDFGLIPHLEQEIRRELDPLLRKSIHSAQAHYKQRYHRLPEPRDLFRLVFWILAGKILHDRGIQGFRTLSSASPDEIVSRVRKHYGDFGAGVIDDSEVRHLVSGELWNGFDFRNLSVEVLAFIYENTLVDARSRQSEGIHATPPSIAKYILQRLNIKGFGPTERRIVEPCCGHGTFLVASLQRLRELLPPDLPSPVRHEYLKGSISGFEKDGFALEVTRLALTLADLPNPNGWKLTEDDVFLSQEFTSSLRLARAVVCNPPFEDFDSGDRYRYRSADLHSVHKPAALLLKILEHLHPDGIIGFVLPRQILDGKGYQAVRAQLLERFDQLELVSLPDKVFENADAETCLLIANHTRTALRHVAIYHSKVNDDDEAWSRFRTLNVASRTDAELRRVDDAVASIAIPALPEVWRATAHLPRLSAIAELHRGIEWNLPLKENRGKLVATRAQAGFKAGYATARNLEYAYDPPTVEYLCVLKELQRGGAHDLHWGRPKVIMNAKTKSRGAWRIAAFADLVGRVCYQTFTALWPRNGLPVTVLAAIMNGPVANAFVSAREGKVDITNDTLKDIPVPALMDREVVAIDRLVREYTDAAHPLLNGGRSRTEVLAEIDRLVLGGYHLPEPLLLKVEHYFREYPRRLPTDVEYDLAAVLGVPSPARNKGAANAFWDEASTVPVAEAKQTIYSRRAEAALRLLPAADADHIRKCVGNLPTRSTGSDVSVHRVADSPGLWLARSGDSIRILYAISADGGIQVQDILNADVAKHYFSRSKS